MSRYRWMISCAIAANRTLVEEWKVPTVEVARFIEAELVDDEHQLKNAYTQIVNICIEDDADALVDVDEAMEDPSIDWEAGDYIVEEYDRMERDQEIGDAIVSILTRPGDQLIQ
ncbi:hypothetical protein LPJ53_005265 [Coemansia erecta]|uniref:Uncharacterized protein n=1 Tax=Coemansia erecta TaxID=147472 RepID=A0A9W7XW20_9FUNG|nr:hypothetical protein LPJ53_005265 [Coemansia erecta]